MTSMRARRDERLARALNAIPAPLPPADLLDRIRADIPAALAAGGTGHAVMPRAVRIEPRAVRIEPRAVRIEPRAARIETRAARIETRGASTRARATGLSLLAHAAAIVVAVITGAFTQQAHLSAPGEGAALVIARSEPAAALSRRAGRGYIDTAALSLSRVPLDLAPVDLSALHADLVADRWPSEMSSTDLVNAFDYADPAPREGDDLALVVEGAPAPGLGVDTSPRAHMLRVGLRARTIDAGSARVSSARSGGPAHPTHPALTATRGASATVIDHAEASIDFDPRAVARWRATDRAAAGAAGADPDEPRPPSVVERASLAAGEARSAVFEVDLQPDARPDNRLATFEVRYGAAGGEQPSRRVRREVFVDDLAPSWDSAPPSLRIAALAARFPQDASPAAPREVRDAYLREVRRLAAASGAGTGTRTGASASAGTGTGTGTSTSAGTGTGTGTGASLRTPCSILAAPAALARLAESAARLSPSHGDTVLVGVDAALPPFLVERVEPLYPPVARRARVGGTVVLSVMVDETGRVADVGVLRSVPALDRAASDAVRRWRYRPSLADGQPVPGQVFVSVTFVP